MDKLTILGKQKLDNFEFTGIEGGFGEDKRAIFAKDIAVIHGRELKDINRNINNNRGRFVDGIDIHDLKQVVQNNLFLETGGSNVPVLEDLKSQGFLTQAEIGNAKNIYLLSERGYSKLLKILEDDVAWRQYDIIVDNYFNMRKVIRTDNSDLSPQLQLLIEMERRQNILEERVDEQQKQIASVNNSVRSVKDAFAYTPQNWSV